MSKDIWFQEFERRLNELEDAGDPNAYERAGAEAHDLTLERLADMADRARQQEKDERQ